MHRDGEISAERGSFRSPTGNKVTYMYKLFLEGFGVNVTLVCLMRFLHVEKGSS